MRFFEHDYWASWYAVNAKNWQHQRNYSLCRQRSKGAKSLSMKTLWQIKGFPLVLLIVILLQGAHASYYSYGYIYLEDLQVDPFYMGMIINIAVICEILYFMKADTILTKWRSSSLLLLALSGSSLRWLLIFMFPNVWFYCFSNIARTILCSCTLCLYSLFNANLTKGANSKCTGLYSALAMGLSTAILTFLGGYLYEFSQVYPLSPC